MRSVCVCFYYCVDKFRLKIGIMSTLGLFEDILIGPLNFKVLLKALYCVLESELQPGFGQGQGQGFVRVLQNRFSFLISPSCQQKETCPHFFVRTTKCFLELPLVDSRTFQQQFHIQTKATVYQTGQLWTTSLLSLMLLNYLKCTILILVAHNLLLSLSHSCFYLCR